MNTASFFGAALLGLAVNFSAHAQVPATGMPGAVVPSGSPATRNAGAVVPGQPTLSNTGSLPTGTVPQGAVPTGTYPGSLPARNLDGGTQRADQPRGTNPAVTGSQQTRSLNRKRTGQK